MNRRRKNNIVIGTLCAVLVLMGVGYAILSATLNIGGTANITGDFDIHFTSIQRSSSTITDTTLLNTMDAGTGITTGTNNHEGTFTAVLQKPTDYVIYEVEVANTGSIDGYLTFTFGDTNSNFNYYKDFYSVEFIRDDVNPDISTDILQPNATFTDSEVLENTTGTRTYKIKVTYKESASGFPDTTTNGAFECSLNLTYSQQASSQEGGNTPTPVSSDGWLVDNNGLVIQSPSNAVQNGVLRIPAVDQNGNHIISLNGKSILPEHNILVYVTEEDGIFALITDQENYEKLSSLINASDLNIITNVNQLPQSEESCDIYAFNLDPNTSVENFDLFDTEPATNEISVLDLSEASYLTTIGNAAFTETAIESIIFNNSLTTIGDHAFSNCNLNSLNIPSSLTRIEYSAFSSNRLSSLDLSNATSLTFIGKNSFGYNKIQSLTLTSSLTDIQEDAFQNQYDDSTQQATLRTIYIPFNKLDFENEIGSDYQYYFDNHRDDLQLIYTDVTCDYNNSNCVAN